MKIVDTGEEIDSTMCSTHLMDLIRDRSCSICGVRPVTGWNLDTNKDIVPVCLDCMYEDMSEEDRIGLRTAGLDIPDPF